MEEEMQKVQKLESIGLLAGEIAHDFNNLLTGIIGNLSLAELYAKPEDKIFQLLKKAQKASQNATNLTQQLLTFSKGGAPIKEISSLSELIIDTVDFSLRGSNIKCEYLLPDNLWLVEIDRGQISQVLNNLVINANQAMPEGGSIKISAENVAVDEHDGLPIKKGNFVKISIKDQGIGIPDEYLHKIFDPYFTTKQEGSGLGLATCHSIIKKHGGHITVESALGVGTTFSIYLPTSGKESFSVKNIVEDALCFGKGKILLMDDEQDVLDTAEEMLIHLGYQVEIAKNSTEALKLYNHSKKSGEPFEAVILDLTIPGDAGGKEAVQRLLEIDPLVKTIVSSSNAR